MLNFSYSQLLSKLAQIKKDLKGLSGIYSLYFMDSLGLLHQYIGRGVKFPRRINEHVTGARNGSMSSPILYNTHAISRN